MEQNGPSNMPQSLPLVAQAALYSIDTRKKEKKKKKE
jgi:hypothetical protein